MDSLGRGAGSSRSSFGSACCRKISKGEGDRHGKANRSGIDCYGGGALATGRIGAMRHFGGIIVLNVSHGTSSLQISRHAARWSASMVGIQETGLLPAWEMQ